MVVYLALFLYGPLIVFLIGGVYLIIARSKSHKVTCSSLPDILGLLSPQRTPLMDLLQTRSIPNSRLRHAFNLSNTFVTSDKDVHTKFVKEAKSLIRTTPDMWFEIAQRTLTIVEQCTPAPMNSSIDIPYHVFIQRVVLKAIMASLFKVNPSEMVDQDVDIVANGINDLWQISKVCKDGNPSLLSSVNTRLVKWVPHVDNPLNLVIPTFETMWRVVAVTVALIIRNSNTKYLFSEYLSNPTHTQYELWPDDSQTPSVDALIRESLRLHPPTRRISRAIPMFPCIAPFLPSCFQRSLTQVAVADVGTVHRNSQIWGPDADSFDAMRHHPKIKASLSESLRRSREQGMLAFGAGPLKCVAYNWAPQFVGIVVAAVLEEEGVLFRIAEGSVIGGREVG
ncbi:hypothetical protein NLI96_g2766 [Meripilus lineatus]|uniref:Cytochrome P450 n=1 Tax=Meripilus lineatus TaxID=2056292 RepID=A0AAD5YLN7_9APHY|nr:hypothetical protein NLI96_g2766 [Physisporinus lineatus]